MRMASTRPWLLRQLLHRCPLPANSPGCSSRPPRGALEQTQALVAQLQQHPELTRVQQLVQQGTAMIRQRQAANLEAWLQACRGSPSVALQNCAEGLQRDYAAVKAALTLPLVNRAGRRSHQPLEADQAQWIWPDEA